MDFEPTQALYLHIPFCTSRCAYCDFTTEAVRVDDPRIDEYMDRLGLEVRRRARRGEFREVKTIYIGGGTPTFAGARRLSSLLYLLGVSLNLNPDIEVSIEANPESLTLPLVRDLWALGVNRISIGVQSFDDGVLRRLGRAHDAETAKRAIQWARERFSNVSIDLMAAVPGQSRESLERSISEALTLGVTHLSLYPLSIEVGTEMKRRVHERLIEEIAEDVQADELEAAFSFLRDRGFEHYEVASFAKPGCACRHNLVYWSGTPYEGIGRGAVSMRQSDSERLRVKDGVVIERLDRRQMIAEDLMLALRTSRGAPAAVIERARVELDGVDEAIEEVSALGLAVLKDGALVPTQRGFLLGNELYGRFLELAP